MRPSATPPPTVLVRAEERIPARPRCCHSGSGGARSPFQRRALDTLPMAATSSRDSHRPLGLTTVPHLQPRPSESSRSFQPYPRAQPGDPIQVTPGCHRGRLGASSPVLVPGSRPQVRDRLALTGHHELARTNQRHPLLSRPDRRHFFLRGPLHPRGLARRPPSRRGQQRRCPSPFGDRSLSRQERRARSHRPLHRVPTVWAAPSRSRISREIA